MFYCSTISALLFHLDCSTVAPLDDPLLPLSDVSTFHHPCSVPPLAVLLFHYLSYTVPLFRHQVVYCSTFSAPLLHLDCSTIPPSDDQLFLHQMFHFCSIYVPLFHHQILNCSTSGCFTFLAISFLPFHRHLFHFSTIRCFLFPP